MDLILGTKGHLGPGMMSNVEDQAEKCYFWLRLTCDCKVMSVFSGLAYKVTKDSSLLKKNTSCKFYHIKTESGLLSCNFLLQS